MLKGNAHAKFQRNRTDFSRGCIPLTLFPTLMIIVINSFILSGLSSETLAQNILYEKQYHDNSFQFLEERYPHRWHCIKFLSFVKVLNTCKVREFICYRVPAEQMVETKIHSRSTFTSMYMYM